MADLFGEEDEDQQEMEVEEEAEDDDDEEEDILDMGDDEGTQQQDVLLMRFCPHDSSILYPKASYRARMKDYVGDVSLTTVLL